MSIVERAAMPPRQSSRRTKHLSYLIVSLEVARMPTASQFRSTLMPGEPAGTSADCCPSVAVVVPSIKAVTKWKDACSPSEPKCLTPLSRKPPSTGAKVVVSTNLWRQAHDRRRRPEREERGRRPPPPRPRPLPSAPPPPARQTERLPGAFGGGGLGARAPL